MIYIPRRRKERISRTIRLCWQKYSFKCCRETLGRFKESRPQSLQCSSSVLIQSLSSTPSSPYTTTPQLHTHSKAVGSLGAAEWRGSCQKMGHLKLLDDCNRYIPAFTTVLHPYFIRFPPVFQCFFESKVPSFVVFLLSGLVNI